MINTHNLTDLGYKIFLDRYAQKDMNRNNIRRGDIVIAAITNTGSDMKHRSEVAIVDDVTNTTATVITYPTNEQFTLPLQYIDKPLETAPEQLWKRVADGIASVEETRELYNDWSRKFEWLLRDWKFVPGGRILAMAGTNQNITALNCFVLPNPHDSREGIINSVKNMAEIMARGGGVGINVSSLRPHYAYVKGVNGRSSGSVSWGALYSFVTGLIEQGGKRRGALMVMLDDWHPDLFEFINAKRESGKITNANISVTLSDKFMRAVKNNALWYFEFPDTSHHNYDIEWDGDLKAWKENGNPTIIYGQPDSQSSDEKWDGKTIVPNGLPINAKDVWDAIIESAWDSAEPGLWFKERTQYMSNSNYYNDGRLIATNPCGEQSLSAYAACNLGAINLSKFYSEDTNDVNWADLGEVVTYAVRFLDNVLDYTPYPLEENKRIQQAERRLGLGIMGLAELLIKLGIRYGSDEGVKFTESLFQFIAENAYIASAVNAKEKGSFAYYDDELFFNSGYMYNMPDNVKDIIKEHGIRNVTLLTVAPTGCVVPNTLISTGQGIKKISQLGDINGDQWQDIQSSVITDNGEQEATKFYINGNVETRKITTSRGFEIEASLNHRLRAFDKYGNYVWKYVYEIKEEDTLVLMRDTSVVNDKKIELITNDTYNHANSNTSKLPAFMTEELAEVLGYYMGDGYIKETGGLHFVINNEDLDLFEHFEVTLKKLFGSAIKITREEKIGCTMLHINSRSVYRFFVDNGFAKPKGNKGEGAEGAFIPIQVLNAGRNCISAFLRGLFEADGSATRQVIKLATVSENLSKQVQVALLSLGIVSNRKKYKRNNSFGKRDIYAVRCINRNEGIVFEQEVGFLSNRKKIMNRDWEKSGAGDSLKNIAVMQKFYNELRSKANMSNREIFAGRIYNKSININFVKEQIVENNNVVNTELGTLINTGAFFDTVNAIEKSSSNTYDISVPNNHTYIANGFVSHNSTGTMVNTSTGIEPFFSWVYYRQGRLGFHEENAQIVQDYIKSLDVWSGDFSDLPDYFVTAMDLTPLEHVKMQAAAQRWVDASISKTVNAPNNYSINDVSDLYMALYDTGCKGGTIYRDGSRSEQVLTLKKDEETDTNTDLNNDNNSEMRKIYASETHENDDILLPKRAGRLIGVTLKGKTPYGTAFITINEDPQGVPFEVFITVGKSGSDLHAQAESMGRMLSLALQMQPEHNRVEALSILADQNRGIGGARPSGFGPQRVTSFADAIAKIIQEDYLDAKNNDNPELELLSSLSFMKHKAIKSVTPDVYSAELITSESYSDAETDNVRINFIGANTCPECGNTSLIRQDGCSKCHICGYSEC